MYEKSAILYLGKNIVIQALSLNKKVQNGNNKQHYWYLENSREEVKFVNNCI
jgi:hypothetical protein